MFGELRELGEWEGVAHNPGAITSFRHPDKLII